MALIKCSECKKDVSTKAEKCPHCGAPVKAKTCGCAVIVAVVFGLGIVGSLASTWSGPSSSPTLASVPQTEPHGIFKAAKAKFERSIATKYNELLALKAAGKFNEAKVIVRQFEAFKRLDYESAAIIATEVNTFVTLAQIEKLDPSDAKARSEAYAELTRLNPTNAEYKQKAANYAAKRKQQLIADIKTRVDKMPANDTKGHLDAYAELSRLQPDYANYSKELARYQSKWKDQEAARLESEQKQAAERQRLAARDEKIKSQFSAWDGSHRGLESIIKKSMNDPDSYKHVATVYSDLADEVIVKTTFRGTNKFGGVVTNWIRAKFTLDGQLVEILSQGS